MDDSKQPRDRLRRADLPASIIAQLHRVRTDTINDEGKQEGPWALDSTLDSMEFQHVDGHAVLLPEDAVVNVVRCIVSADNGTITLFGRDNNSLDAAWCGVVMICERWQDANWYVPVLQHPWLTAASSLAEQLAAMARQDGERL